MTARSSRPAKFKSRRFAMSCLCRQPTDNQPPAEAAASRIAMIRNRRKTVKKRRAVVLFAVLIVVSVLALAAYHYSDMTMAEYRSVDSYRRSIQAHAAANSGIHYAAAMLSDSNAFTNSLSSYPYDNSSCFPSQIIVT